MREAQFRSRPVGRFALIADVPRLQATVEAAREAEALGFEAVLVGESTWQADAFVRSAAVLQATQHIRCGPGVVNVHERHPVALARAAAGLDRLAPGRAQLGVGRGDPEAIERALGIPAMLAGAALEDTLRICGALLRGERVSWRGRRWSAELPPLSGDSVPGERVPLLCAAVGERTLRLAGALADGVVLNYAAPPEYVAWAVGRIAEGADDAGRDPADVDVLGIVLAARTDTAAGTRARSVALETLRFVLGIPDQGRALAAPSGGVPAEIDDDALRRFGALGDKDEVDARLEAYRRAGLRSIVLLPSGMRSLFGQGSSEEPRL